MHTLMSTLRHGSDLVTQCKRIPTGTLICGKGTQSQSILQIKNNFIFLTHPKQDYQNDKNQQKGSISQPKT